MLPTRLIRELRVDDGTGSASRAHLSAASGIVKLGHRVVVVADDEHHLATFDLTTDEPGRLVPIFAGDLPSDHAARKAAKPDCEALLVLPAFGTFTHGALMAFGSGSRPSRQRAALLALNGAGDVAGPAHLVDIAPLLSPLHTHFSDLNIEGAFVDGDTLALLQRGNGASAINARIDLDWREVKRWLTAGGTAPGLLSIRRFDLGTIDGVPLSFTDGAALPGGEWVFSAAAEDTSDTYQDGRCLGSAVGLVDANGTLLKLERVALDGKIEGIAVATPGPAIGLLLVTDADDRDRAALLLSAVLHR
jgi:hypothetical protein